MFDYDSAKKENIPCNLCGEDNFLVLATRSKNNLDVQTCLCRNCGLIYINPRMTKGEYDNYYKYYYRIDRSNIKSKEEAGEEKNFENARKFGNDLATRLAQYLNSGLTVDIGSSIGGILYGLREIIPGLELLGVEPSVSESNHANLKGIKTINALFEDFATKPIGQASNILCVQTFNHLLDPRMFLEWSYKNLKSGGNLIIAVKNFRHQVRKAGFIEAGVQIDHPYMFAPETLKFFVEAVGFKVLYLDVDEYKNRKELWVQRQEGMHRGHIRIVAEKPENVSAGSNQVIMVPRVYRKLRLQLFRPYVKLYYFVFHSSRFGRVRKFFGV